MESFYDRTELLLGEEKVKKLSTARIAVFGVGGVGGFAFESLVRCGIKNIDVFDGDTVKPSNLNRQIIATNETLNKNKVDVAVSRAKSINPDGNFRAFNVFYSVENSNDFPLDDYDFVIDAIDSVSSKIELIKRAKESDVEIISCMGTGGKLEPEKLTVADIKNTEYCPLARVVRRELKKIGIENLTVVFSPEVSVKAKDGQIPSTVFVPAVAGILLANHVVKKLLEKE